MPARVAIELLQKARTSTGKQNLIEDIRAQAHSYSSSALKIAAQQIRQLTAPGTWGVIVDQEASLFTCSKNSPMGDVWYSLKEDTCDSKSGMRWNGTDVLGKVWIKRASFRDKSMGAWRFSLTIESAFNRPGIETSIFYSCKDRLIKLKGQRSKSRVCVVPIEKSGGLYFWEIKFLSMDSSDAAVITTFRLFGASESDALRVIEQYTKD